MALPLVLALLLVLPLAAGAEDEPPMLLGPCTTADLQEEPYAEWYEKNHDEYEPHATITDELAALATDAHALQIVFGTWCGDSKREVPRWIKLAEAIDLEVELIAVGRRDELYKRLEDGSVDGMGVFRVPTIRVLQEGAEIARVVEYPVQSIERDLRAILRGETYTANYRSYPWLMQWQAEGLLDDPNVSARGLAETLRGHIASTSELGAAARSLREQGHPTASVKVAEMNAALNRDEARAYAYLAQAYLANDQPKKAHRSVSRALRLNDDPEYVESLTELLLECEAALPEEDAAEDTE